MRKREARRVFGFPSLTRQLWNSDGGLRSPLASGTWPMGALRAISYHKVKTSSKPALSYFLNAMLPVIKGQLYFNHYRTPLGFSACPLNVGSPACGTTGLSDPTPPHAHAPAGLSPFLRGTCSPGRDSWGVWHSQMLSSGPLQFTHKFQKSKENYLSAITFS